MKDMVYEWQMREKHGISVKCTEVGTESWPRKSVPYFWEIPRGLQLTLKLCVSERQKESQ